MGDIRDRTILEMVVGFLVILCALVAVDAWAALEIDICGGVLPDGTLETCAHTSSLPGDFTFGGRQRGVSATGKSGAVDTHLGIEPTTPVPTPSGWTNPTPPSLQPVPPGTASGDTGYYITGVCGSSGSPVETKAACCASYVDGLGAPYAGTSFIGDLGGWGHDRCYYSDGMGGGPFGGFGPFLEASSCPAGYVDVSGTCTLDEPSDVIKPSDGKCAITRVSNTFVEDPKDPDCSAVSKSMSASGDTASGSDGLINVQVKINGDGTVTVTDSRPSADGNTQTTLVGGSAPGGGGEVTSTGFSRNWTEGSGSEGGSGSVVVRCGGPGQVPCKIDETGTPTDSGSFTAGNAALDTAQGTGTSDIATYASSAKQSDLGITFGVTWPDVVCSDPSFNVFGHTLTVEFCQYEADVNAVVSWFLYVLAAFAVFGMIREVR